MKLIPYSIDKLNTKRSYTTSEIFDTLTEFLESGLECVKVEGWKQCSPSSCSSSFSVAIKRYRMNNIRCVVRDKQVFLVKTNV